MPIVKQVAVVARQVREFPGMYRLPLHIDEVDGAIAEHRGEKSIAVVRQRRVIGGKAGATAPALLLVYAGHRFPPAKKRAASSLTAAAYYSMRRAAEYGDFSLDNRRAPLLWPAAIRGSFGGLGGGGVERGFSGRESAGFPPIGGDAVIAPDFFLLGACSAYAPRRNSTAGSP